MRSRSRLVIFNWLK